MKKRILAIVLAIVMCISLLPISAFAEEETPAELIEEELVPEEIIEEPASQPEPAEEPVEETAEEPETAPDEELPIEEPVETPHDTEEPQSEPDPTESIDADAVSYIDANGQTQTCTDYTVISSDNIPTALAAGWYVVTGAADYTNGGTVRNGITVSGAVHLILTDGCALTVKGADDNAGIGVGGGVNTLTIYGQTAGTGKLNATGGNLGAGIGGGDGGSGSSITINGGTVTAIGGTGGAGIGGGRFGHGSNITINGGTVTATGGSYAAGIGGGRSGNGSNITINGGTVTATGKGTSAGIGGGIQGNGSDITINGGIVTADGSAYGAGIGGGEYGTGSDITITGGYIKVTSESGEKIGSGDDGDNATGISLIGGCYADMPETGYIAAGSYFADNMTDATAQIYPYAVIKAQPVAYLDADGSANSCSSYTVINNYNMPLTLGNETDTTWYMVIGAVDYTNGGTVTTGLTVNGAVHLILADDCTLTVKGANDNAGIEVGGGDNTLTIYGQTDGTGKLNATGGYFGAGIGGRIWCGGGDITINGGTVVATGGTDGAGIGGGYNGKGTGITINGGTVNATGGSDSAGIGGGIQGSCSSITINGGTVKASGGSGGAGIGGGYLGYGGGITINGGTVTANGCGGAGIGGGLEATGGNITITGGCIDVAGGAGIGAGDEAFAGTGIYLRGGCYKKQPNAGYIPTGYEIIANADETTAGTYPHAVAIKHFAVSFDMQGHGTQVTEQDVNYGSTVTAPEAPEEEGYTFGGWYKEAECENAWNLDSDEIFEAITLYAKWSINSYTLSYNMQGHGTQIAAQTLEYGSTVTAPAAPVEILYIFGGWYKEAECENIWSFETDIIRDDTTLYAKWTARTDLSLCSVVLSYTSHTYTGSALKPTVTVKLPDGTEVEAANYTVSYSNNTNIGTAGVTVTAVADGLLLGGVTKSFTINPKATTIRSATNTSSGIKLTWTKVTGATGYMVYRSKGTGSYTLVNMAIGGSTVTWTDTSSMTGGTRYRYKIITMTEGDVILKSDYSDVFTTYRLSRPAISSVENTSTGIKITWGKVTGATGYKLYRSTGTGSYKLIKTITSGTTVSYSDTGATTNGTRYRYKIVAVKTVSGTAYTSAESAVKTMYRLSRPTISSATSTKAGQITVKWGKNDKATGYQIKYVKGTTEKTITVTSKATVSKVLSSLTKGATYKISVRSYKTVDGTRYYSAWSAAKSVTVKK